MATMTTKVFDIDKIRTSGFLVLEDTGGAAMTLFCEGKGLMEDEPSSVELTLFFNDSGYARLLKEAIEAVPVLVE